MNSQIKRVGMLLFEECDLLDFSGPTAVFHSAALHLIASGKAEAMLYDIDLFSIDGGPVRTLQGVVVDTRSVSSTDAADLDTLIVAGGFIDHRSCDPRLIDWIHYNHEHIRRVASVCCGAFLLAASGALDGRPATTHWADCARLKESFPNLDVRPDSIFVQDDKFWTAAGITAGIDMALALVEEDHGHALSLLVARSLVVFLKRPGGQSQFSAPLQSQCTDGPIGRLLQWIVEHPDADLRSEALADRAAMSLRNFYRAFEAATGTSPAEWVEMARVEIAKRRLEQSADKVEQVAVTAGFKSYEQMRRTFTKRLGVNPSEFRSRFGNVRKGPVERAKLSSFRESPIGQSPTHGRA
jgi:transcriptional regulator GlxA family with amidase domain